MRKNSDKEIESVIESDVTNQPIINDKTENRPTPRKLSSSSKTISLDSTGSSKRRKNDTDSNLNKSSNVQDRSSAITKRHAHSRRNSSHEKSKTEHDSHEHKNVTALRRYFDGLNQHTIQKRQPKISTDTRKSSYTITERPIAPLRVQTDLETPQRTSNSVEELRQIFEQGSIPKTSHLKQPVPSDSKQQHPKSLPRSLTYNTKESRSQSFKYRTPSPTYPINIPSTPPLPLPPSPEHCHIFAQQEYTDESDRRFEGIAPPIPSMRLPYRSRSLAAKQSDSSPIDARKIRYRAGSLTQRSLSPDPEVKYQIPRGRRVDVPNNFTGREEWRRSHSARSFMAPSSTQTGNTFFKPYQSIDPEDQLPPRTIIHSNRSSTDGVYVRSAVVYERMGDDKGPRNFITTYIHLPTTDQVSGSTREATNLWIAEHTLSTPNISAGWPPYRTQALTRNDYPTSKPVDPNQSFSTSHSLRRVASPEEKCRAQGPRSLSLNPTSTRVKTTQPKWMEVTPKPLPSPPPISSHPYILRCSSPPFSPYRSPKLPIVETCNRATQCTRPPIQSPSPTRSWSIKSFSPPPFRSQPLNTMKDSRFYLTNSSFCSRSPSPLKFREPKPSWLREIERRRSPIFRSSRNLNTCYAEQGNYWIPKARSLSRERQTYHEVRGSWSPPHIRSPARETPNDLEEDTEREIRYRVREQKPISLVSSSYGNKNTGQRATETNDMHTNVDMNEVIYDPSSGIDTTSIIDNFQAKRAYFEKLIENHQILAKCSFYSDCYHCPPPRRGTQTRNCRSANLPNESGYQSQSTHYTTPSLNGSFPSSHEVRNYPWENYADMYKFDEYSKISRPQQYSSSLYTSRQSPRSIKWDQNKNTHRFNHSTHEYYAKPPVGMPKVAPNPSYQRPFERWDSLPSPPTRAEIVHSPVTTFYSRYDSSFEGNSHSPPCRFYSVRSRDQNHPSTADYAYGAHHVINTSNSFDRYNRKTDW